MSIKDPTHGLTEAELRKLFPEASEAFIRAQNPVRDTSAWIPPPVTKPVHRAKVPDPREGKGSSAPRFTICFTISSRRPCDWDNYWTKGLQDALVHAGVLPDDDWKSLVEGRVQTRKVHREEDEGVTVEIFQA